MLGIVLVLLAGIGLLMLCVRYNTFYVLYPIGISSECTLIYQALGPAAGIDPMFRYFLIAVLVIYIPGVYYLVSHLHSCTCY